MTGIGGSNPFFGVNPQLLQLFAQGNPVFGSGFGPGIGGGDPLAALIGFMGQNGGGMNGGAALDPRMLKAILAQLDRAIVEQLLSGGLQGGGLQGGGLQGGGLQGGGLQGGGLQGGMPGGVMPGFAQPGNFGALPGFAQPGNFGALPGFPQPGNIGGFPDFGGMPNFGGMPCAASCFPQNQLFNCFPGAMQPQNPLCWPGPGGPGFPGIPGFPPSHPSHPQSVGRSFDVWFENKDGQKATQRSPIVLDLNANGRPDLTGNVGVENGRWVAKGGANKIDFDIDPSKRSWGNKSIQRRPGAGAPEVPNGYAKVYDAQGNLLRDRVPVAEAVGKAGGKGGITTGRAEVFDANNQLVGELKQDEAQKKMMYHWGNRKDAEKTEWMAAGGGDGLLVWDFDNSGKIDSSKKLFGEFDIDGQKKFANGYQKLGAYFDMNGDGAVAGAELARAEASGVKVWRDVNGDGKTDAGELQSLGHHGIQALGTRVDPTDMSSVFAQSRRVIW